MSVNCQKLLGKWQGQGGHERTFISDVEWADRIIGAYTLTLPEINPVITYSTALNYSDIYITDMASILTCYSATGHSSAAET